MEHTYFIGIDGGGSKTKYLAVNRQGTVIGSYETLGTYCAQDGIEAVTARLQEGIRGCLPEGTEAAAICFGMPGLGENKALDEEAIACIAKAVAPAKIRFENDVTVGWAASLALQYGISVVGGTGSIAYGQDPYGKAVRCGGWHEFFSDEGSGYWLGKKALGLFSKMSDGRLERTALYSLMREKLALTDDMDLNAKAAEVYAVSRRDTAALQRVLLDAAQQGDPYAKRCYAEAAEELASIILGVARQLTFQTEEIPVSYSGGLFNLDDLICKAVQEQVTLGAAPRKVSFRKPLMQPCEGALLLAAEAFAPELVTVFQNAFQKE